MNLHRAKSRPDWMEIAKHRYNIWQHIALRTHGIFTPANILSGVGLVLVGIGLTLLWKHYYLLGGGFVAVGRLLDIADGWVADLTGTKSPFGELIDVTFDKIATFGTLIVFYLLELAPWWVITALLLPHVIIAAVAMRAARTGRSIHPSRAGKLSMATAWISLIGLVIIKAASISMTNIFTILILGLCVVSVGLGVSAAIQYARTPK